MKSWSEMKERSALYAQNNKVKCYMASRSKQIANITVSFVYNERWICDTLHLNNRRFWYSRVFTWAEKISTSPWN